jgi:hypothetical protein
VFGAVVFGEADAAKGEGMLLTCALSGTFGTGLAATSGDVVGLGLSACSGLGSAGFSLIASGLS